MLRRKVPRRHVHAVARVDAHARRAIEEHGRVVLLGRQRLRIRLTVQAVETDHRREDGVAVLGHVAGDAAAVAVAQVQLAQQRALRERLDRRVQRLKLVVAQVEHAQLRQAVKLLAAQVTKRVVRHVEDAKRAPVVAVAECADELQLLVLQVELLLEAGGADVGKREVETGALQLRRVPPRHLLERHDSLVDRHMVAVDGVEPQKRRRDAVGHAAQELAPILLVVLHEELIAAHVQLLQPRQLLQDAGQAAHVALAQVVLADVQLVDGGQRVQA
mmetsp:Transcript_19634/g.69506  ORF Transcript_19634/g.69506 Transcript_19634/m.69506 type:complete len:274 (-) Transcript_19634:3511-4332(-)